MPELSTRDELVTKRDALEAEIRAVKADLADRRRRAASRRQFAPAEEMRALEARHAELVGSIRAVERELQRLREREGAERARGREAAGGTARDRAFVTVARRRLKPDLFAELEAEAADAVAHERAQGANP